MFRSLLLSLVMFAINICAAPVPNVLFGDHAVLQRDKPVAVWGTATPGEKVKVTFNSNSAEVTADANGRWLAHLPALRGGEAGDLVFEGGGARVVSTDVLVGDVWLCTGQSNMEWPLRKSDNAADEIAAANYPRIRHFKVLPRASGQPEPSARGKWSVCSPDTAGDFTAVGYFMARDLLQHNGEPQGLINCTWGGRNIENWLSAEAIASDPRFKVVTERWEKIQADYPTAKGRYDKERATWTEQKKAAEADGKPLARPEPKPPVGGPTAQGPSGAYNAMLHPLAPYTVRANIWYQGEANSKFPEEYGPLLGAFIGDFRTKWNNPGMPFVVVQLPGLGENSKEGVWPFIREGQAGIVAKIPSTALVVTTDLGNPKNVHPTNKRDFGSRVALTVRRLALGEAVDDSGPVIVSATTEGTRMRVKLADAGDAVLKEGTPEPGMFELAGEDRVFHPAAARFENGEILAESPRVPRPVALRYAWRPFPKPFLVDKQGLPAAPFRTDNWPREKQ